MALLIHNGVKIVRFEFLSAISFHSFQPYSPGQEDILFINLVVYHVNPGGMGLTCEVLENRF